MQIDPDLEHILSLAVKELKQTYDESITRSTILRCVLDHIHCGVWHKTKYPWNLDIDSVIAVVTTCKNEPKYFNYLVNNSLRYRNRIVKPLKTDIPNFGER